MLLLCNVFTVIYVATGLIVGAIIRYSSAGATVTSEFVTLPENTTYGYGDPPDNLKLTIKLNDSAESAQYFQYDFKGQIDKENVNEKELEDKVGFVVVQLKLGKKIEL